MSEDHAAEEARRRHHAKQHKKQARHHLSPKGRHATRQAQALSKELHAGLAAPGGTRRVNVTPAAHELAATLAGLRQDLAHSGDAKASAAAKGLADLQTSVTKMAQANAQADPNKAAELLYAGIKAFQSAQRHAKEAGGAWPL